MNTTPTLFTFQGHQVRTLLDDQDAPWFVAKDACDILGLENVTNALARVPDNHKGVNPINTLGGIQEMLIISEPGLYRLVLRSDKPQAEPFMEWVTAEVLPSIRRTGSYGLPDQADDEPLTPALATGPAPVTVARLAEAAQGVKAAMIMARAMGYREAQARRVANELVRDLTGIDALQLLGASDEETVALSLPLAADLPPAGWVDEKTLARFVADCCETSATASVEANALYHEFCRWLRSLQGEHWPMPSRRQFTQTVSRHFRRATACKGCRHHIFYLGLSLPGAAANPEELPDSQVEDVVKTFLSVGCVERAGARVSATDLYRAFVSWCAGLNLPATPSQKAFGTYLKTIYPSHRLSGCFYYLGLTLGNEQIIEEVAA